jgi:hypothetical protein
VRWSPRWSFGGDLLLANDVAMLFLMTIKPRLTESLLAVVLANVVVLSFRLASHRSRSAAAKAARSAAGADRQLQLTTASSAPEAPATVYGFGSEIT